MRLARLVVVLVFGLMLAFPQTYVNAEGGKVILEGSPIEISVDTAIYSKYIWRGITLDRDPVLQSGVYASAYGFDASIWGSFPLDSTDALDSDELDYSVGYTYSLEEMDIPASLSGGYTYYDFPSADLNSQEFYLGLALDVLLSPSVTWYHDFEDEDEGGGDGNYILVAISHSFPLDEYLNGYSVSLDLSSHVGFNNELFIIGDGGDVGLGAGLTFQLAKNATLVPGIGYSIPFGDLRDSDDGNEGGKFYGGAVIAYTF